MRDGDNWEVCAQIAKSANCTKSHFSQKSQFAQIDIARISVNGGFNQMFLGCALNHIVIT